MNGKDSEGERKVFGDLDCVLSALRSVRDKYINLPCTSQLALMLRKLQRCQI